jgi:hypothetical protein
LPGSQKIDSRIQEIECGFSALADQVALNQAGLSFHLLPKNIGQENNIPTIRVIGETIFSTVTKFGTSDF